MLLQYTKKIRGYGVTAASSDLKSDVERRAGSNPATRTKVFSPGGEMVDTLALGASAVRCGSSSLPWGTTNLERK